MPTACIEDMTMDDFDYLASESNAAWLEGRGDGRFEQYERFYQTERTSKAESFDLEATNEGYATWAGARPSRVLRMVSAQWFGRVLVAFFCVYLASRTVPTLARAAPVATAVLLGTAFVALRVFHRKRRKQP
ncbi:hypothetical protein [Paraburkholderia phenazinium]|uniref:hypothetical protein n=2 Tax=Paraburkholderia phenazinium TaxID=60549 RepID=UPI001FC926C3|nr:hypothetical protein [Paraburkholderia phenazinium]